MLFGPHHARLRAGEGDVPVPNFHRDSPVQVQGLGELPVAQDAQLPGGKDAVSHRNILKPGPVLINYRERPVAQEPTSMLPVIMAPKGLMANVVG